MNDTEKNKEIKDRVLEEIKLKQLTMESRARLQCKYWATISGLMLFIFFAVYFGSFAIFARRAMGLGFRPRGPLFPFFLGLPWLLIVLAMVAILLVEWLVRRYTNAYRKSIFFSLVIVVGVALLGSMLFARLRIHEGLASLSERRNVPFLRPLYREHLQRGRMHGMFPPTLVK